MDPKNIDSKNVNCIQVVQYGVLWQTFIITLMNVQVP
jgi:hypothetical protein